ncbi:MAG TPA: WbqC family protein, partial [Nitrosomonas sp.]|nr:WbqC family protein [Nitrosomonas sp.]
MVLSIHQPSYFPWLGLLHKIAKSDVYMVMDEVQLSDSAFQNRNLFLSPDGKEKFLTIGFNKKGYLSRRFFDLEITQTDWQVRHLNTLKSYYGKHRFFADVFPYIESIFSNEYPLLLNPVVDSMRISMQMLDIPTKIIFQHDLEY